VIDKAVGGAGVLSGPMPTGHGDWFIPVENLPYEQDLEGARALLAEAGFPDGFSTTITCSPQYPEFVAASVVLQEQLGQVGIDAEVIQMEWGQFVSDTSRQNGWNYDIKITAFTFYPDPDGYLFNPWQTDSASNYTYTNPDYDAIVAEARSTLDAAKRHELYDQAQQILLDESPAIFWYVGDNIEALPQTVQDYTQSYTGRRIFLKKTWLSEGA
jgi:peptide/nickel transport system substrate-binding protein